MKKLLVIITLVSFSAMLVPSAQAGRYYRHGGGHYYKYNGGHHHNNGNDWLYFGVGALTGAFVSYLFYRPYPRYVYVQPAQPAMVYQAPVVYQAPPVSYPPPAAAAGTAAVTVQALNVRSGPGANHPVIGVVYLGETLVIHGNAPGWLYVRLATGQYGWVMSQFTSAYPPPARG